jgi:hypothetical protein
MNHACQATDVLSAICPHVAATCGNILLKVRQMLGRRDIFLLLENSDIVKSSHKRASVKTAWPAFTFSQMTFSLSAK